ncbi:D-alanyl-D-alanine carboxypeptidase [Streptomyces sp. NPDC051452]|uniref:D-alanyl-D-alanine carboxypeptidase n=1 Tax=Streptomyces sp. NPDC051452 TaxID=3365654 RepID=UPI00379EA1E8
MEEASVAGESPDRSKQRESSAEPTSGSGGSVPEARDPRLAVTREKDSSGGRADTATKILSVRDVKRRAAAADEPAQSKSGAESEAAAESESEAAADSGETADAEPKDTPKEDVALREAVSAWVRGAEDPKGQDDTPPQKAATKGEKAPEAEKDTEADAEAEEAEEADAEAEEAEEAGKAAHAATAAKADADTATESAPKPAADTADTAAKSTPETDATRKPKPDTTAEPKPDAKPEPNSKAEPKPDTKAEPKPDTETKPAAKPGPGTKAGAGSASDAKGGTAPQPGAGATAGGAEGEPDEPEAADGEDAPQGPPAPDDETRTGGAGGNTDAEGEAEATPQAPRTPRTGTGTGTGTAVDQPTAVFKAPRPKSPEVDQPTTMLKLGGTPKAPTPRTPESDSERTSKFVALKNDMRSAVKPGTRPATGPGTKPDAEPDAEPSAKPATAPDATAAVPQVGPERTTQQPLPPKPPLDLLAELTNTPPPAETPVRTLMRRVKIWTPLVLLLAIIFAVVQNFRPLPSPTLALTGKDSYTFQGGATNLPWPGEGQGWIDGDGIGTMGRFGKQTPVAIGSVAKTMTAYIILRDHPLKPGQEGPKIKVDATAEKEGGYNKDGESTLNTIKAGDSLTEKQALSAVIIPSANNIARLLARWDAGSEAAFVKKMNATAKELGLTRTTYTDPSGLKETTVSTAEDQVKLGRAFVKVPALVAISSAASWTDPSGKFWPNYNELPFRVGAIGIKTGSTTKAGGNLLFASRKQVGGQTVTIVGAILGQHKPDILQTANEVSKTALLAAEKALTSAKILKKGDVVGYVDDGLGGHTPIVITKDVTAAGWAGLKVRLSFVSGTVPHTAKAGTTVGSLTVGDGTARSVKVPVALRKDLPEPGFGAKLTRLR